MKYPGGPNYDPKVHKPIQAQALLSLGHTTGNLVAVIREELESRFPKNYFKGGIKTDTRVAFMDLGENSEMDYKSLLTNSKPLCQISPRFDYAYASEFFDGYFHNNISPYDFRTSDPFLGVPFADHETGIALTNTFSRIQMRFDITIVVDTELEARNLYGYIIRHFPYDRHLPYLRTTLENQVPNEFIKQIALDSGFIDENKPYLENDQLPDFMKYLNTHSPNNGMRFVRKFKNSTANKEIFSTFEVDTMWFFEGPPSVDDGEKKGMTKGNYNISLNLVAQCTVPSVYYYTAEHSHYNTLEDMIERVPDLDLVVPLFTIKYDYIPCHFNIGPNLFSEYTHSGYVVDEDIDVHEIDMSELFDERLLRVKYFQYQNGFPIDFYSVLVFENGNIKNDGVMDFNTSILTLSNMKKSSTYTLVIYINKDYVVSIENDFKNKDVVKR
ncbi:MAG: hypothetical protein ACRC0G_07490 [Fusobacteriaceae bacterium]